MLKRRESSFLILVIVAVSFFGYSANAATDIQEKAIIKNCNKIRETLKSIQRADTFARTDYLPSVYDEILSNYIIPMESRLSKNGQVSDSLNDNKKDFVETYSQFKIDFVTYSKSMEKLLNTNCEENPEEFYTQLEVVRVDRNQINLDTQKMNKIIEKQKTYVSNLRKEEK